MPQSANLDSESFKQGPRNWLCQAAGAAAPILRSRGRKTPQAHEVRDLGGK